MSDNNQKLVEPTIAELEEWSDDGICEAACPEQCMVELDGTCEHGNESWFIVLGLI